MIADSGADWAFRANYPLLLQTLLPPLRNDSNVRRAHDFRFIRIDSVRPPHKLVIGWLQCLQPQRSARPSSQDPRGIYMRPGELSHEGDPIDCADLLETRRLDTVDCEPRGAVESVLQQNGKQIVEPVLG